MKELILSKVDVIDGHWIPRLKPNNAGYVQIRDQDGNKVGGHVLAYRLWKGEVPFGWQVDHGKGCPKSCWNPEHLKAVPRSVNQKLEWRRRRGQMSRRDLRIARYLHNIVTEKIHA